MVRHIHKKAGLPGLFVCTLLIAALWWMAELGAAPLRIGIAKAEVGYVQRSGEPLIVFTMTEAGKRAFAQFTTENVGRMIEIRVNGRVVSKPIVREPILGGAGQLPAQTAEAAKQLAEELSAPGAAIEVEIVPQ